MAKNAFQNNFFRSFLRELYLHLLGLLVFLFLGLYFILFIPTLIFRPIAKFLRKYLRPDLGNILSTNSSMFAQTRTENSSNTTVVIQVTFQGILGYEPLLNIFQDKIIDCKKPDGKLRYPEFQQFITNWMGYKFWKCEENFNLRDHIKMKGPAGNDMLTPRDIRRIGDKLASQSFKKDRSPWEIILFPGVVQDLTETTLMFLRYSHTLGDGFSMLYIFQRLSGYENTKIAITPKLATIDLSYFLLLPFKVLRVFGELAHNSSTPALWKIPEKRKSPHYFHCTGENIPVETIKKIKNKHGVSFTSVVYALIAGGIRRFLLEDPSKSNCIPLSLPSMIMLPLKGIPQDCLDNKFSFASTSFPVGISDPGQRLKMMHKNFEDLRNSPIPLIGLYLAYLHGCHFNSVAPTLNNYKYAPIATSYFPVGDDWAIDGKLPIDCSYYFNISQGEMGGFICIQSICGKISITPNFNASVLKMKDVERLSALIVAEAEILLNDQDQDPNTKSKLI